MNSNITRSLNSFSANFRERNYKKGDIVIRGDDEPAGVYLIKSGLIKMSSINEEGDELSVNIFKPGTFFPMDWAIGGVENSFYYQTLSEACLVRVPKEEFLSFLKTNPEVSFDLTKRILVGMDGLLFNIRHLLGNDSVSKISVIIFMLAKRFGLKKGRQIEIGLTLTHQDISHFAGLTRETTTIAISRLVEEGIVIQRRRKIIVKNVEALKNSF